MANIPTLNQLYTGIVSDIEAQYGITLPLIGKVALRVIAMAQAGKMKLLYLVLGNLQKNIFVDTAEPESIGGTLERFIRVKLGRNPFPAVAGKYNVTVTGTIGALIKAQTTFKSDDDSTSPGFMYILDSDYTMVTVSDTIVLRSLTIGLDAILSNGNTLTATAPISLVDSKSTVVSVNVQPLAAESLEDARQKTIQSYQLEPQGGAATDYMLWSNDAQGVRRVYPYANSGTPNQIDVFVEATLIDSVDGQGTPTALILSTVTSVINYNPNPLLLPFEAGRRPLDVSLNVVSITKKIVDIDIVGYVGLTLAIQTQITTTINSFLYDIRPFIDSADTLPKKNFIDINTIIGIVVSQFPGAQFISISLRINTVSVLNYTFNFGDIPVLNTVTFI